MITVIDAPPGCGKTSWAIQEINTHEKNSYIYCTPFLTEITRIRDLCKDRFVEPQNYKTSKIDNFNFLLETYSDIAVTHSTFLNATNKTIKLIKENHYTLFIDEALDVIQDFNKVVESEDSRQKMSPSDIKIALDTELIFIDGNGKVSWIGEKYDVDNKFHAVYKYANLNRLYCVDNAFLLIIFPPEIFDAFDHIYVLTYMFDSSMLRYYFEKFGIQYDLASVKEVKDKTYQITEYDNKYDIEYRRKCKKLINICNNQRLNNYTRNALSKEWFKNKGINNKEIVRLRANLKHFLLKEIPDAKASNGDLMWTTFSSAEDKLQNKGYIMQRKMTKDELKLPEKKKDELKKKLKCFVPCNAKATNIYKDRWALAYCLNINMNPEIAKFFAPIKISKDAYSLSTLIQWIHRSRIRDDQPIEIYIPCPRMRKLLIGWLNC